MPLFLNRAVVNNVLSVLELNHSFTETTSLVSEAIVSSFFLQEFITNANAIKIGQKLNLLK
jgi:hypothetical protein